MASFGSGAGGGSFISGISTLIVWLGILRGLVGAAACGTGTIYGAGYGAGFYSGMLMMIGGSFGIFGGFGVLILAGFVSTSGSGLGFFFFGF